MDHEETLCMRQAPDVNPDVNLVNPATSMRRISPSGNGMQLNCNHLPEGNARTCSSQHITGGIGNVGHSALEPPWPLYL